MDRTTKFLVDGLSTKINHLRQELCWVCLPVWLDLSTSALRLRRRPLAVRRRRIGTRWRRLTCGRQALLALAHLRGGHTHAHLAAGFAVGIATAYRYIAEAVEVLAALAPSLAPAAQAASTKALGILDSTLLPIDRIAANRPSYSGKHKRHGMNVQVIADPFGRLRWASPALPGAVHDIKAARTHGVLVALAAAGVRCGVDKGYQGAGGTVWVPCRGRGDKLSAGQRAVNVSRSLVRRSAPSASRPWVPSSAGGSCASSASPATRITTLVKAVLTLQLAISA